MLISVLKIERKDRMKTVGYYHIGYFGVALFHVTLNNSFENSLERLKILKLTGHQVAPRTDFGIFLILENKLLTRFDLMLTSQKSQYA